MSNKNIGGYILVDCGGLNLLAESSQTISGFYKQCKEALATKKPIFAVNCKWGDISISPFSVLGIQLEEDTITFTSATLQVVVDDDNEVTINNLAPPPEDPN